MCARPFQIPANITDRYMGNVPIDQSVKYRAEGFPFLHVFLELHKHPMESSARRWMFYAFHQ